MLNMLRAGEYKVNRPSGHQEYPGWGAGSVSSNRGKMSFDRITLIFGIPSVRGEGIMDQWWILSTG